MEHLDSASVLPVSHLLGTFLCLQAQPQDLGKMTADVAYEVSSSGLC